MKRSKKSKKNNSRKLIKKERKSKLSNSKTKMNKSKNYKVDPRSKRIFNNINKLEALSIEFTFDHKKKKETFRLYNNIIQKYNKLRAGAHDSKSLDKAKELYENIVRQDEETITEYLNILECDKYDDYSNENSDKLVERIRGRPNIINDKLKTFMDLKTEDSPHLKSTLRAVLITDDIIAGGLKDTKDDIKEAKERINKIYKNSIDKSSSGMFSKMGKKLLLSATGPGNDTAYERAISLSMFFMKSIDSVTSSNVDIDIVAEQEQREGEIKGMDDPLGGSEQQQAAADIVKTKMDAAGTCAPAGRTPQQKAASIAEEHPLCVDKGALYTNILQVLGMAITPLTMATTSYLGHEPEPEPESEPETGTCSKPEYHSEEDCTSHDGTWTESTA